jgi:dTDP-4-amino-4,6-dideoxy-D-galactose acyltransferase
VDPFERLSWDSDHFGFPVARVPSPAGVDRLKAAALAADRAGIRCLVACVEAGDTAAVTTAEDIGFRCYDVRVELARAVGPASDGEGLRSVSEADLERLEPLAARSFFTSRFYADPHFPTGAVDDLYVAWLRRGVTSDERLVLTTADLDGFVIGHLDPRAGAGTVELIAVAERSRGRGLGGGLLRGAEAVFARARLERARVVTQGANLPAQRLYQREGYLTSRVSLWLHRWMLS